jgi:hypothetical protein
MTCNAIPTDKPNAHPQRVVFVAGREQGQAPIVKAKAILVPHQGSAMVSRHGQQLRAELDIPLRSGQATIFIDVVASCCCYATPADDVPNLSRCPDTAAGGAHATRIEYLGNGAERVSAGRLCLPDDRHHVCRELVGSGLVAGSAGQLCLCEIGATERHAAALRRLLRNLAADTLHLDSGMPQYHRQSDCRYIGLSNL